MDERRKQLSGAAKAGIPVAVAVPLAVFVGSSLFDLFGHLPIDVSNNTLAIRELRTNCEIRCAAIHERLRVLDSITAQNSSDIRALQSKAESCYDPFTGTDCRDVAEEMKDHERRLDKLEQRKGR